MDKDYDSHLSFENGYTLYWKVEGSISGWRTLKSGLTSIVEF